MIFVCVQDVKLNDSRGISVLIFTHDCIAGKTIDKLFHKTIVFKIIVILLLYNYMLISMYSRFNTDTAQHYIIVRLPSWICILRNVDVGQH